MLHSILFVFIHSQNNQLPPAYKALCQELRDHNTEVLSFLEQSPSASEQLLTTFANTHDSSHSLLVSNNPAVLQAGTKLGLFGVGYSTDETFLPAKYCFEDFKNVNYSYFSEISKRYRGEPISILSTRHLQIRELCRQDLPALYEIYKKPSSLAYMEEELEDFETFYEKKCAYLDSIYSFYHFGIWGVFLKEDGSLIGECGIEPVSILEQEEISIGYLLDPAYQHKGYGKEMVQAVLRYAKRHFEITHIIAKIQAENAASIALAKSCKMTWNKRYTAENRTYEIYTWDAPVSGIPNPVQAATATEKVYSQFQANPDTSTYGKRYTRKTPL